MLPTKNYADLPKTKNAIIYCFFLVKSWFFIEKVHILRITHFSETTKDRNLIFGMGGDANVKLCIQLFYFNKFHEETCSQNYFRFSSYLLRKTAFICNIDRD
jgi:hypothetical protein